jgi:hypothetical protein
LGIKTVFLFDPEALGSRGSLILVLLLLKNWTLVGDK